MGALRDFVAEVLELEGAAVESVEPARLIASRTTRAASNPSAAKLSGRLPNFSW